jgi:putative membrane protein
VSIRQFTPRKNRRRGISSRAQNFLKIVLGISILLQVSYPLVNGEILRVVTLSTVYFGAAAMLLHAYYSYGTRYVFSYALITFVFALLAEEVGVRTGWPFGTYSYSSNLGIHVLDVPLVVPFAWVMMAHPILVAARRVSQHWIFLYGGTTLMAWDLFLDPQMVRANRWHWVFTGPHVPFESEIPLSNAAGWLFAGMGLMALLNLSLPKERRKISADSGAVDLFLGWTALSGIVGNLFFFSRPGIALLGGSILCALLAPYFFSRWLGRP